MDALTILGVVLIGLLAGGLINALADDLPQRVRIRLPHYPDGSPRAPLAWLGILAFVTGQRRSATGSVLPWRHPVTELLTAALMLLALYAADQRPAVGTLQVLLWLVTIAFFVLITVIDIEHRLILIVTVYPFAAFALLDALITPDNAPPPLVDALIGGVLGYAIFWLFYKGGELFVYFMNRSRGIDIREVAFGFGDVRLAGVVGLLLGWRVLLISLYITIVLGALGALTYIVIRKIAGHKYAAFSAIPYGPYIVAGAILVLLFPEPIGLWLLGGR